MILKNTGSLLKSIRVILLRSHQLSLDHHSPMLYKKPPSPQLSATRHQISAPGSTKVPFRLHTERWIPVSPTGSYWVAPEAWR